MTTERSTSRQQTSLVHVRSDAWWLSMFEQCDVKYLALDPDQDRSLIQLLQSRPEWTLDLWDQEGVLFVRSDVFQAQGALAI